MIKNRVVLKDYLGIASNEKADEYAIIGSSLEETMASNDVLTLDVKPNQIYDWTLNKPDSLQPKPVKYKGQFEWTDEYEVIGTSFKTCVDVLTLYVMDNQIYIWTLKKPESPQSKP